ncbi:MAG: hypothetical protein ACKVVT_19835 [Dehalococcoidia bacterium]
MPPRISPPRIVPEPTGATKPPGAAPETDAFRQTGFVLGEEVDLVLEGLRLEGALAEACAGAKFRSATAPLLLLWSRSWLARQEALHAVQWGNYPAAIPLVRASADYQAAMKGLAGADRAEWDAWVESEPIAIAAAVHGTEVKPHAYRSAETLASDAVLGPVYRAATELSMPHFAASIVLAGNDSGPDRILATFGERSFHLGLAELVMGWLLALGDAQLRRVAQPPFPAVPEPPLVAVCARLAAAAARDDRCRVEPVEIEAQHRLLIHNWRATPGSAAKKLLF